MLINANRKEKDKESNDRRKEDFVKGKGEKIKQGYENVFGTDVHYI